MCSGISADGCRIHTRPDIPRKNQPTEKINVQNFDNMIEQPEPAIIVTNVNPGSRRPRQNAQGVEHRGFESIPNQSPEAMNLVHELRERIEAREAEVARLREVLHRDDEVDIRQASEQLKELQAAFEQVQRICAERMKPFEQEYHKAIAKLDGKGAKMDQIQEEAKERAHFLDILQEYTEQTTARLIDPPVTPVDETVVSSIVRDTHEVQTDIEKARRAISLEGFAEKQLTKLNELLQRQYSDAVEREEKAQRKRATARKDIDVRCESKKPADGNYFPLLTEMEKRELDLEHMNKYNGILRDDIRKMTESNRSLNDSIARMNEELLELGKYLPSADSEDVSKPGTIRNLLATEEAKRDQLQVQIVTARAKFKIHQQRHNTLQAKLSELPSIQEKRHQDLDKTKERRAAIERELRNEHTTRSELMSEKIFITDEKRAMEERLREHKAALQKIQKRTQRLEVVLQRQLLIREYNDKKDNLKNCNLERVAQLVSSMVGLHQKIGDQEPHVSSSSSTTQEIPSNS